MDLRAVVPEQRGGLVGQGLLGVGKVDLPRLCAHHEANLPAGVRWDGAVRVAHGSPLENLEAERVQLSDDVQVEPDRLGLGAHDALVAQRTVDQVEKGLLKKRSRGTCDLERVRVGK